MPIISLENGKQIKGQSMLFPTKELAKYFSSVNIIEIPALIALKFDLKEGDCLMWHYFDDEKSAIVTKREGWKSRNARLSRDKIKNTKHG
jgi:hypothetical protein